ncbi:MAG: VOC family protein [Mariprofundaceae bacterium]|nr:VOC family protein [Mariprofundaceae bacterium]
MHLLHVSIIVSDLSKSEEFYGNILGLQRDARPDLGFDGLFYKLGDGQQLHVMCIPNPYQTCKRPEHGGRDRHIALAIDDLREACDKLDQAQISYTRSRSGRAALFCYDDDNNAIELCETPTLG